MSRRATEFQTIRSEGGLLPPDLLRRVVDPSGKVPGVEPGAYGLPAGERINEAITQSWNRLRRCWAEFRAATKGLPEGDATTGLTNDKWSLPLLRELGFGFLATSAGPTIDGKTYAISRFAGNTAIHLVGCGVSLDRRAAGVRGAAAGNPHGLVQEFLNRSPGHLWAIASNGLAFRILRDNQALSRQSFLEFDLEAMFDGEVYSDFVLLWLVGHASRFMPRNDGRADSCWLETWSKEAAEQGVAALTDLRGGVEKALEILGQGFVSHPRNTVLREALRKGDVKLSDFHHQLLRVVYRLIFLFVSEDRELEGISILHPQDKSEKARLARERYAAHYSTSRLRELASRIKGSRHGDLWRQFQLLVGAVSGDERFATMRDKLALPSLGSMLWNPASTALLNGPGLGEPGAELSNVDFLDSLRHLAFIRKDKILRPVDYKNLGSEEFGGVYESFLALTPQISSDGARFTFAEFAGNERKTSGSYYTPDSLVQCLLDSALDPVVNERLADAERLAKVDWPAVEKEIQSDPAKRTYVLAFLTKHAGASKTATAEERKRAWDSVPPTPRRWKLSEEAILAIKVCDKACGSGHFLVGAGHRLARHLARVRALAAGESEPSPLLYQTALRDVIGHCLYGVDINPMAVELCKVTLWLEALEPGKPLSFLDHHIRCGNSLLGTTPELISAGLPDETFNAIEGDDKEACSSLKKLNKAQREGLRHLFIAEDNAIRERMHQAAAAIDEISDSRPEDIHRKEAAFRNAQQNYDFQKAWDLANLWCAAFVIKKGFTGGASVPASLEPSTLDAQPLATQGGLFGGTEELPKAKGKKTKAPSRASSETPIGITTQHLRDFVAGGELPDGLLAEVKRLTYQYQFFHFHLAFPEVFAQGGFDISLGNPPWDALSPDQREFFGKWVSGLRSMSPDEQQTEIDRLLTETSIAAEWAVHCRYMFALVHFFKSSGVFTLYAPGNLGKGDFNIYRMFVESALRRVKVGGFAALVVPGGLYGGANASAIRKHLLDECELYRLLGLINTKRGWFKKVDIDRFAAFAAKSGGRTGKFLVQFGLSGPEDLARPPVEMDADVIRQRSPETYAIPDLRNIAELATSRKMYAACPTFGNTTLGPPVRHYSREIDMGNDRGLFTTDPTGLPVYEGRMLDHFDHRAKTYDSGHGNSAVWIEREFGNPAKAIVPQWRVLRENIPTKLGDRCAHFRIGFCDVANPRNERSFTSALIPPGVICGHKVPTFVLDATHEWAYLPWLAVANSFAMDWLARCRLNAPTMSYTLLDSLPFPRPVLTDALVLSIAPVVLRLVCTAPEMTPFWNRMAALGFVEAVAEGTVPPTALVEPNARATARAELDAFIAARVFGLTALELSDILDTFDVLRRRDEKAHGEFRTKKLILDAFATGAESMQSGTEDQTRLAPIRTGFRSAPTPSLPQDKRIAWDSAEKFLLSFVYGFLHQTHAEATFDLLDSVFHLLRHRDRHADEFAAAIGGSAKTWLSSFNDKLPNKDFLPFLKRLEADGWITADRRTGHLSITEKFPAVPFDAWRNFDISAALRVIAQQPEVAKLVLAEPDTPLASREFKLQKTG